MKQPLPLFEKVTEPGDNIDFIMQNFSIHWESIAQSLHRSAMVLYEIDQQDRYEFAEELKNAIDGAETKLPYRPKVFNQALMLAGFAIENILKSFIIHLQPEVIENGKYSGIITSHNLLDLAREANATLNEDEKLFCQAATTFILVDGRYPVGKNAGSMVQSMTFNTRLLRVFDDLYHRLIGESSERFKNRIIPKF